MSGVLIAIASVKGAPGVTTLAVGLAALWPEPGAVLVECDPDGGDLAARFGHHPDPGLAGLAASTRTGTGRLPVAEHVQRLAVGADVVLGPGGDSAAASVRVLAANGGEFRRLGDERTVILDLGRLACGGPGMALAAVADHLLLVTGGQLSEVVQVQARLGWLRPGLSGRLWLVRAGQDGYRPAEIARALGVKVIWDLPRNRLGAGALSGQLRVPNWRQLALSRAIRGIATTLTTVPPASVLPEQRARRPVPAGAES